MSRLCQGKKKCVGLSMIGIDEDINMDLPVGKVLPSDKFSYQVAWTLVKKSKSGLLVRISCSKKSYTWLQMPKMDSMEMKTFDKNMFEGI